MPPFNKQNTYAGQKANSNFYLLHPNYEEMTLSNNQWKPKGA